jgi:BlaI family transcriptional regulator, penicillinase repressor
MFMFGGRMKRDLDSIILTRQELQIMKVVWELGSATVKEVCGAISQQKNTAYTTILTLMGILEEKGVLVHQRCGRAYKYRPLLSRNQAVKNQIRDLVARFFDDKPEKLIEKVLEHESMAPEQISQLATLLKPLEQHQIA